MCFLSFVQEPMIISVKSINWLGFIIKISHVLCEVRTNFYLISNNLKTVEVTGAVMYNKR
jgi:hypothetical protein